MAGKIKMIKGFQDALPPESDKWALIEDIARRVFSRHGYGEIRIPLLERTELFARGIGETTDIVEKEMFTFPDRRGRSLSLRPEGTAGAVRAYLQAGLPKGSQVKWFYRGPMFRYERPQKGRYRQFHQIGAEAIGHPGPGTDAELISMLDLYFRELGLSGVTLELNSLGCPKCRPAYREALVGFLIGKREALCEDCLRRLEKNPLRVLDCKVESCKEAVKDAPSTLDHLGGDCRDHFEMVKRDLERAGVGFRINPGIVRGLDYYTRTVFEHLAEDGLGSQNAVAAGGRYDGLVEEFGGPPTPAIGFALGVERLGLLLDPPPARSSLFFIVTQGDKARGLGVELLAALRSAGFDAAMLTDDRERSVKSQMKQAGKSGAAFAVTLGDAEVEAGTFKVKTFETGEEEELPLDNPEASERAEGADGLPAGAKVQLAWRLRPRMKR